MLKPLILLLALIGFANGRLQAQSAASFDEVNAKSYALYEKADWKNLLNYGKQALNEQQDFSLLRLRLGYAAFMLGNFSEAIKHYEAVLKNDSYNSTARYYLWLCRKLIGQNELADVHSKYLSKEVMTAQHLTPLALTKAAVESSFKNTTHVRRGNSLYARLDIETRLGWSIHMQHSVALYDQNIAEPSFTSVTHNEKIAINQKEYYNKTTINLNQHWQLKAAYHYLKTPFNNFSYNNHAGLVALKYHNYYFEMQTDAMVSKFTDSTGHQYNFTVGLYPNGNLNFYSYSTATLRTSSDSSAFNFKEVVGVKLVKSVWLEGNVTIGSFSNLFENDALYVYNAIDRNLVKAGATIYVTLTPTLLLQAGYTFERRELYNTSKTFYQHSTTGGLSWKL